MLSSVVWTGRLPQKFSNTAGQRLLNGTRDIADASAAIDHDATFRLGCGEIEIAAADVLVEFGALIIDARFGLAGALVAAFGAGEAGFEIDINQDGGVRLETLAGDAVEFPDDGGIETAPAPLINERRIGEAIAQDDLAKGERGADNFLHVMGAAGEIELQFGAGEDGGVGRVEQDAADVAADFGAAGLYGFDHFAAVLAQTLGEEAELRGFAAAVHAFER